LGIAWFYSFQTGELYVSVLRLGILQLETALQALEGTGIFKSGDKEEKSSFHRKAVRDGRCTDSSYCKITLKTLGLCRCCIVRHGHVALPSRSI
jgi:hypothetical protein